MNDVLFRCRVRGTDREGDRVRMSLNWAFAQRAELILTGSALVFANWAVSYAEIEDAALVCIPRTWWRLIVRGRGTVYQFLLPPADIWTWEATLDPFWNGPLPFPVRRVAGRLERRSVVLTFLALFGGAARAPAAQLPAEVGGVGRGAPGRRTAIMTEELLAEAGVL